MKRRLAAVAILAVAVFALLTSQVRLPDRRAVGAVGGQILNVFGPVQVALARAGDAVARIWRLSAEIGQLRIENRRLREDLERLSEEVTRLREQAQATQRLERLLGFREQIPGRAIGARVIARNGAQWFSVITVDRGARDGVRRNAPVVTAEGLVGRVLTVTPTTAQVLLITDSRSAVGVVLQQSREAAVAEGTGADELRLKYISRSREIATGERVVTSGMAGIFPRGLLVGTVTAVVRESGAVYQEATVRPAANLDHLEEVLILIDARPER
jgi:rod shape-determining protein MreC